MYLARRIQRLHPQLNVNAIFAANGTRNSFSTSTEERIEIPKRIQRSPTDILRALSNTVGRDPTATHYKFHDDPYLIPKSNVTKRAFAMAQESGRKAANWIKEEHRQLFMHEEAQPAIKAFAPKMVFTEESEVDETSLQQLILQSELTDAVFVYNLMKSKGIEVSNELKQSLLELVCFYNNEEPLPDEFIEERWFNESTVTRDRHLKTWKDGELAEQLYNEIEPKTAATYAALIRGMAKYYQAERAYALLQEAREKQIEFDINTYNSIIQVANFLKETADQRWELCCELLQQIAQQKLMPNLSTLNALLEAVSTFGNFKLARGSALKVLSEFKGLGITPSLGTYYYILIIFCRERAPVSHVLVDILREIEGKSFKIQHPRDTYFFTTAMDICRNHLHDKSLAKKVDALLHTGDNYNLIGDSYKESIYYRHYIGLLSQTETIEDFMTVYDSLVPGIYIPEPGIMEEILKSIEINGAIELVPRIWSDMVIFDHINRESLLTRTLRIMLTNKPNTEILTQRQLPEQFAKVALDIFNKIQQTNEKKRNERLSFTGSICGDIISLLVRGDKFEEATNIFAFIEKNQHSIPGTPTENCLAEYIEACITNKMPSQAVQCLTYAVENNMESLSLAKRINTGFTLNEIHLSKIKSLVGDAFLEEIK